MKVSLGCDHAGFDLMQVVKEHLTKSGIEYVDCGTTVKERCDYPDHAEQAALAVTSGQCDKGILICSSGIGISIAANKVKGIRAALCHNLFTAEMCRRHNNANIIAMGAHEVDEDTACKMVDIFLATEFDGGRHTGRVEKMMAIENK